MSLGFTSPSMMKAAAERRPPRATTRVARRRGPDGRDGGRRATSEAQGARLGAGQGGDGSGRGRAARARGGGLRKYETADVFPDWVLERADFTTVDSIIKEEKLREALQAPAHVRSHQQLLLVTTWLQAVWPTAERLGPKRVQAIAKCVRFFHVKRGDVIIREGEPGRTFYILVSGRVDVSKQATGVVAQLKPGDSFGEIALMHGQTTRSATICAATEAVEFLVLHKTDYDTIMKEFQSSERMQAFKCLARDPARARWARSRLDRVCSLLQWRYVKAGAVIIRQGEKPDNVYFVLEGRCEVTKDIVLKAENRWPTGAKNWTVKVCTAVRPFKVLELGPGSYFGEKAIIEDALRAATVTAATDCTLLSLDKLAFLELLNRGHSLENVYSKTQGYPSDEDVLALFSGLVDGKQSGNRPRQGGRRALSGLARGHRAAFEAVRTAARRRAARPPTARRARGGGGGGGGAAAAGRARPSGPASPRASSRRRALEPRRDAREPPRHRPRDARRPLPLVLRARGQLQRALGGDLKLAKAETETAAPAAAPESRAARRIGGGAPERGGGGGQRRLGRARAGGPASRSKSAASSPTTSSRRSSLVARRSRSRTRWTSTATRAPRLLRAPRRPSAIRDQVGLAATDVLRARGRGPRARARSRRRIQFLPVNLKIAKAETDGCSRPRPARAVAEDASSPATSARRASRTDDAAPR